MLKIYLKKLKLFPSNVTIILIRLYQISISPILTRHFPVCRFYPSCSEYTLQAIKKFGMFKGGFLGAKRLVRCHPFCQGGWDPVPNKF